MLSRPIKCGQRNFIRKDIQSPSIYLALFAIATSIVILSDDNSIQALKRGTMFDDLMVSNMTISSINQTGGSQGIMGEFTYGDYGNDEIRGSDVSDHLSGGPGNDLIYGNGGGDFIEGGPGIDSLYGGAGNDVLSGGEGADYFDCGAGTDSIDDFNSLEGDFAETNCEILENEGTPTTR